MNKTGVSNQKQERYRIIVFTTGYYWEI